MWIAINHVKKKDFVCINPSSTWEEVFWSHDQDTSSSYTPLQANCYRGWKNRGRIPLGGGGSTCCRSYFRSNIETERNAPQQHPVLSAQTQNEATAAQSGGQRRYFGLLTRWFMCEATADATAAGEGSCGGALHKKRVDVCLLGFPSSKCFNYFHFTN